MGNHTINDNQVAWHGTVGTEEETITFTTDQPTIEVVSADGAGDIYFTLDGTTPTTNSPNAYIIPASAIGTDEREPRTSGPTIVKLIATAPTRVSVQRGN